MIINSYTPRCSSDDPLPDNLLGMHIKRISYNLLGRKSSEARGMASEFMILLFLTLVVAHGQTIPGKSENRVTHHKCINLKNTCDELAKGNSN